MSPWLVFAVVAIYFSLLLFVAYLTSRGADNATFFNAHRKSPWFLVAFGMIGTSISGVTFISVPGMVQTEQFSYFQMVIGYILGYFAIAFILLPVYYKLNLVSIYKYLGERFGKFSHKTGSALFLISRTVGASFRLYIAAVVLQIAFFDAFKIPFAATVLVIIFLIWLYTKKAGIKTVVYTDTLQTTFLLAAVIASIWIISKTLHLNVSGLLTTVHHSDYSKIFFWDWHSKHYFLKEFFSGAFIAFVMTGLDQDLMQKNLTCKSLKESQKNVITLSFILVFVNLFFLSLGILLYKYAAFNNIPLQIGANGKVVGDSVFPTLAIHYFGPVAGIIFLIGIVASTFASSDSALTSLTTAFSIDFLNFDINDNSRKNVRRKNIVHICVSLTVVVVILIFKLINNDSVISQIFRVAGYTYGPLLGLFVYGLATKWQLRDKFVPYVAFSSPFLTYAIVYLIEHYTTYKFGNELLIMNGMLTFTGLWILKKGKLEKKMID